MMVNGLLLTLNPLLLNFFSMYITQIYTANAPVILFQLYLELISAFEKVPVWRIVDKRFQHYPPFTLSITYESLNNTKFEINDQTIKESDSYRTTEFPFGQSFFYEERSGVARRKI